MLKTMELMGQMVVVEASPKRIYANEHPYLINSIIVNSDAGTYLSAEPTICVSTCAIWAYQSFNIDDIKPANM